MANSYDPGNILRITGTFTDDVTNLPLDPAPLVLKVQDATGAISSHTPVRDSPGIYYCDVTIPLAAVSTGYWTYSWEGSGSVLVSSTDTPLQVRHSVFAP